MAKWRDENKLPFPEFADEDRARLEDTIDYPPQGAIGHQRPKGQASRPVEDLPEEPEPGEGGAGTAGGPR